MAARRVSLKRDFAERSAGSGRGFGPGGKRQDTTGAQGRSVMMSFIVILWFCPNICNVPV